MKLDVESSSKRGFKEGRYCRIIRNKKRPASLKALILLGWLMGFEPTTTGITIRDSTAELQPPSERELHGFGVFRVT